MAQGPAKKMKAPAVKANNRRQTGSRVFKPKKASAVKAQKFNHKHTAGLAAATEKSLAGKAGHLELLRGGKKDKKAEKEALAKKANAVK